MKKIFLMRLGYMWIRITLIFLFLCSQAWATTYYAATDGSGSDCTIGSPCSFTTGLGKLTNGQSHTLYLRGGTYSNVTTHYISNSGQDNNNRHIISGYPGETAILDGEWTNTSSWWDAIISLDGNYLTIQNMQIKRGHGKNLQITGDYCSAINIDSSYAYNNGMICWGADNCVISGGSSYYDCYERVLGDLDGNGNWASCVSHIRGTTNSTIEDVTVSYCSGESLSMYTYSEGGNTYNTIQDCTVYHSGPPAIYIQNCRNCTVQRNLLYMNSALSGSNIGIYMQDEQGSYMNSDNTIVNNMVKGFDRNFYWGHAQSGDGLINTVIAGNTFVNAKATSEANMKIDSGSHSGSSIKNNIFLQEDSTTVMLIASGSGLGFGYNNYDDSQANVDDDAEGTGDNYSSDPLLTESGSTADGAMTGDWFKLQSESPCIDDGTTIAALTDDYFGTSRPVNSVYDMGAYEYETGAPTLTSATISSDGFTLTLAFSENVNQGSNYADNEWDLDCTINGNDIGLTYVSGDGSTSHIYKTSKIIYRSDWDTCNIDHNANDTADVMEDDSDNDLAGFEDTAVTNNSGMIRRQHGVTIN